MATPTIVDRSVRALSGQVLSLAARIDTLETGARASQLGDSSIENGYLSIYDDTGVVRAIIGRQDDGTFVGGNSLNNPLPPPVPKAPTVVAIMAGLKITGNGPLTAAWPADFLQLNVYAQEHTSPTPQLVGTLASDDDVFIFAPLDNGTTWDVWLTSINQSLKESIMSEIVIGSPAQVVATDVVDGIISTVKLADDAVTAAKVAAGSITATEIADGSISTPKIIAGGIQSISLAADSVNASKIAAGSITGREIAALTVTTDKIAANAVTAGNIAAGAITAGKLAADMVVASRIIVGGATGARVEMHPTAGLQAFKADGTTRTFWVNSATGDFQAIGTISTGAAGSRIVMNFGGNEQDKIRFYPSAGAAYASIDSITSTNGAGILMYGATTSIKRGLVAAREDFASLIYGTADLGIIDTDIFAAPDNARVRAGRIDLMGDANQSSDPAIRFMMSNSTNPRSGTLLYFNDSGANEPHFAAITHDIGITFASSPQSGLNSRFYVVGNDTLHVRRDIFVYSVWYEGDVVKPSSRVGKRNLRAARDLDPRQAVRMARPHRFEKEHLDEGPVWDGRGNKLRGARPAPEQLGFVAEDMPDVVTQMVYEAQPGLDLLGVNIDAVITLLWQGLGDLHDQLDARHAGPVHVPHAGIPPLAPTTGATLYEHNGALWAVLSTGKRVALT